MFHYITNNYSIKSIILIQFVSKSTIMVPNCIQGYQETNALQLTAT